nr:PREDICTED: transcription elongation factor SPT5-like [Bemisia tabaci]
MMDDNQSISNELHNWLTTDIEVRIKESIHDPDLAGQNGIVRNISEGSGMCSLFLPEEDRIVELECDYLEPVVPQTGDEVKVIAGEDRENTGQLISVDNKEGVVKLDYGEIKMLQLLHLCRFKPL